MQNQISVLKFKRLSQIAFSPTRGSPMSAGFDLYSAYNHILSGHGKVLVETDIQILLPEGCYGRIAPRSGLAWKYFIDVGAGVIDSDYRGSIAVVLYNFGCDDFVIRPGDRIAQIICEKIEYPVLLEVDEIFHETQRGVNGFGSTDQGFERDSHLLDQPQCL